MDEPKDDTPVIEIKRTAKGTFAKGTPGGPGRRPVDPDVRAMAKYHTIDAIKTLVDVMTNATKDGDRVSAATALLDRAHGKCSQALDITHHDDGADEVRATLQRLQADPLSAAALLTLAEASAKAD
jgi:hypothetical protein